MRLFRHVLLALAMVALAGTGADAAPSQPKTARLEVTHRDLVTTCLNGTPTDRRRSDIGTAGEQTLVFTMATHPATAGTRSSDPGYALVRFLPEAGHRYEVEVLTERPELYRTRRWERGAWKPVVRDRTIELGPDADDRIVSADPEWIDRACR